MREECSRSSRVLALMPSVQHTQHHITCHYYMVINTKHSSIWNWFLLFSNNDIDRATLLTRQVATISAHVNE